MAAMLWLKSLSKVVGKLLALDDPLVVRNNEPSPDPTSLFSKAQSSFEFKLNSDAITDEGLRRETSVFSYDTLGGCVDSDTLLTWNIYYRFISV